MINEQTNGLPMKVLIEIERDSQATPTCGNVVVKLVNASVPVGLQLSVNSSVNISFAKMNSPKPIVEITWQVPSGWTFVEQSFQFVPIENAGTIPLKGSPVYQGASFKVSLNFAAAGNGKRKWAYKFTLRDPSGQVLYVDPEIENDN